MNNRQQTFRRMQDVLIKGNDHGIFVIPWFSGQFIFSYCGIPGGKYYSNMEVKHKAQLKVMQRWPDVFFAPGLRYDFGVVTEPSAFGCQVRFPEDDSPAVEKHPVSSKDDIKDLKVPDPEKDGLYPEALKTLSYMRENTDPSLIEDTGILLNTAYVLGPLEQAAQICGYQQFFIGMFEYPEIIKELIAKTTENTINWIKAQSKVVGRPKVLFLIDHIASLISAPQFEEFGLTQTRNIFQEFDPCIGIYHNEGAVAHNLANIKKLGARVFHFALDLEKTREILGKEICLMGNLDPLQVLKDGDPALVKKTAEGLLSHISREENFILSSGGGLSGNTPAENIDQLIATANNYGGK